MTDFFSETQMKVFGRMYSFSFNYATKGDWRFKAKSKCIIKVSLKAYMTKHLG